MTNGVFLLKPSIRELREYFGSELATEAEQLAAARDLVDRGVTFFHFYTMNRADLVFAICHLLGLRPVTSSLSQRERVPERSEGG